MWFNSTPADLRFCQLATSRISIQINTNASPDRLYHILLSGENQARWAKGYRKTVWFTGGAYEMGSIRDIHLQWIRVRERFLALEPGKRFTFSSDALTIPLVNKMVEDIQFVAIDSATTRIDWTICYELIWFLRPIEGFLRKTVFQPMFFDFAKGLADYAELNPIELS